jgi:hypothetical protein
MSCFQLLVCVGAVALATPAHAALDEVITTGAPDVRATRVADRDVLVREHEGVKELADSRGTIVAAKWEGFTDLHALLGAHYDAYAQALRSAPFALHHVHVKTAELEISIVSYGAVRHSAVALVKSMPKGVTLDALR